MTRRPPRRPKENFSMTTFDFATLGVAQPILRALAGEGYDEPTPIQRQAIPLLLAGRDLLGMAQTGTGKTAAFVLPLLQRLSALPDRREPRRPRALILVPTRELALQIGERIAAYGRNLTLRHAVIYGGVGQGPQVTALAKGIDILVATPGRLLDLVGQKHLVLDRVSILVLDEADRMLDMGFVRDMRRIVAMLPAKRQSLLFSATMPAEIARIAAEFLKTPERVSIRPEAVTVEIIGQEVIHVDAALKPDMLNRLLADASLARVIVFTRTKHGADKVTKRLLAEGFKARAIHGNKSQANRQAAIRQFRDGDIRVLVATDVAARGIDVADITHVVNFDIPNVPESYVHRIGRTGRAGNGGAAISLCDRGEVGYLRDIERLIRRPIARREAPALAANARRLPHHPAAPAQRRPAEPAAGRRRQRDRRRGGSPVFAA
jgi:ATP-dependent RNA helicase RhlE